MDRLLCGDVGYGKTEVAIRAAFKAIADGKQVAILSANNNSGTAALSKQCVERFQDYPISIGLIEPFSYEKATNGNDERIKSWYDRYCCWYASDFIKRYRLS